MSYRSDATDRVKSSISMRAAAERYGMTVTRGGYIACPFHADKTPSLRVYDQPGKGFYCFGCGIGGSVIDFAMRLLGLEFAPAIVRLATDFGILIDASTQTRAEALAARAIMTEQRRQRVAYGRLCAEWRHLTDIIHVKRPADEQAEWPDEWCSALKRLPTLEYQIEKLEAAGYGR